MVENNNIGEQFKGALSDALQTGDYKNLNDLIYNTVNGALYEAGVRSGDEQKPTWQVRAEKRAAEKQAQITRDFHEQLKRKTQAQHAALNRQQNVTRQAYQPPSLSNNYNGLVKVRKAGSVSNVLYKVFGGIGTGIFGILTVSVGLPVGLIAGVAAPLCIFAALTAGSLGMIRVGIGQSERLKRADRYTQLCVRDGRMYGEIKMLAEATGKSEKYVLRDLKRMLEKGMFPEGHLDGQGTCFMLNDVVYRQYLDAENSRRQRELEQRQNMEQIGTATPVDELSEAQRQQEAELNAMMTEGMEYIRKVRELNDRIPGEPISEKLYLTERLLKEIFDRVKEHPEQRQRIHKLQDYYLPTTLKLVEAYAEFDKVSSPGADILEAKKEILKTLDSINEAFTELLNNLFQDAAFDVTTDAQVLQTMLAKEGLTGKNQFM